MTNAAYCQKGNSGVERPYAKGRAEGRMERLTKVWREKGLGH